MNSIKNKFASNLAPYHYVAYCMSFIGYGLVFTGLGPLVPYLSAITGHAQTQYSFIFLCRSIGFLFGALTIRHFQKYFTLHKIIMMASFLLLFISISFSLVTNMNLQGLVMITLSACSCYLQIVVNLCVLETQKNGEIQFWMTICHAIFGIGGFIGPVIVYIFQQKSYIFMGIFICSIAPAYYFLKTPQNPYIVSQIRSQSTMQQIKVYPAKQPSKPIQKIISYKIQILTSFMFFIYIGLQVGYGSWISSYAVLQKFATKQQATKYTSIFWVSLTVWRFITPFLPLKSMKKLFLLTYCLLGFVFVTIFLIIIGQKSLASIFGAITFSASFSSMYPILLAIPSQYNMQMTTRQNANCMVWVAFGEGVLSMSIGYLMQWFTNDMLFYMMFILTCIFFVSVHFLKNFYQKQQAQNIKNQTQRQLIQMMIVKR